MHGKRILLIIAGGIAAYKSLELIRRLRDRGVRVRCILTAAGARFITPLAVASLSGERVFGDLFSLTDEAEMGHIRLSREADLVVVAPATADLIAKMAHGLADDLASTALLATDKPVLIAPAMNPQMWAHAATRRNVATLSGDGIRMVGPNPGDMACGEIGLGRMAEPDEIVAAIEALLQPAERPLQGIRALVTSGPTHRGDRPGPLHRQPLLGQAGARDRGRPGRGRRRGHPGERAGAASPTRRGCASCAVESALQMLEACSGGGPVDVAVCAAAVADWRVAEPSTPQGQAAGASRRRWRCARIPDILKTLSRGRPDAAAAGDRLCRRDGRRAGQRAAQAREPRVATGSSPMTFLRNKASLAALTTLFN